LLLAILSMIRTARIDAVVWQASSSLWIDEGVLTFLSIVVLASGRYCGPYWIVADEETLYRSVVVVALVVVVVVVVVVVQ